MMHEEIPNGDKITLFTKLIDMTLSDILKAKRKLEEENIHPEDIVLVIPSVRLFNMNVVFSDNVKKAAVIDSSTVKL